MYSDLINILNKYHTMQIIIFSLIPAILYLFLMYVTTPYNTWSFNRAIYYLGIGTIAIPIVLAIHHFFPWWNELYKHPSDDLAKLLVLAFIQIALL